MSKWPDSYGKCWTLARSISRSGIGLHSGTSSEVRLLPSKKPGFHLSWADDDQEAVTLSPGSVRESSLCTTIEIENRRLATVEHLLAAVAGCGLTHLEIEASGDEVPILDGSALGWVEAIEDAGLQVLETAPKAPIILESPLICNRGESVITAIPSENLRLIGLIDFPQLAIGKQMFSIDLTPSNFVKEIAPARTFGFFDQVEHLRKIGLIKGACLDNALVCDGDKWLNPPLRFLDEPIRHKLLDLIGDLALVGFPKAQVLVYKGSHALHTDLAASLLDVCSAQLP